MRAFGWYTSTVGACGRLRWLLVDAVTFRRANQHVLPMLRLRGYRLAVAQSAFPSRFVHKYIIFEALSVTPAPSVLSRSTMITRSFGSVTASQLRRQALGGRRKWRSMEYKLPRSEITAFPSSWPKTLSEALVRAWLVGGLAGAAAGR